MKINPIAFFVISSVALPTTSAFAEEVIFLDEISITGSSLDVPFSSDPLSQTPKPNDIVVGKEKLKMRSSTLGNALNGELGVHSSQFGGGASAPVIRGQEGVRLKILQNGSDAVDMSQLSPDHAIGVDTLLAQQVEIVRGPSTLLYANASPAGVINIVDNRIPTSIPEKGYEVDIGWRYNNNSNEKLGTIGITGSLGNHIALRFEGLTRDSHPYHVPGFQLDKYLDYVPDTQNKTKTGTYGISWIGEKGYIGVSYNNRWEHYGIPGHNHAWDGCAAQISPHTLTKYNYYLHFYPYWISDKDVDNPHFHCGSNHAHEGHTHQHSHDHPYGHNHDHSLGGPLINSRSERYDIKAEWKPSFKGLDKLRLSYSTTDYFHDESDGGIPMNLFNNKGHNFRAEFIHSPVAGLTGIWGIQYQTQTMSANIPRLKRCSNWSKHPCHKELKGKFDPSKITADDRKRGLPLIENKNTQLSFFAMEQLRWKDFIFEISARTEKQNIDLHHREYSLSDVLNYGKTKKACFLSGSTPCEAEPMPSLKGYEDRASSYATSASWNFTPEHSITLLYSHNERHPTPMELYYHGNHIATSSFEYGNKDLKKEVSDNIELNFSYFGKKLSVKGSVYYIHFDNRIFNQTLAREGNLSLNRYSQSKAKYYGVEAQVDYAFTPELMLSVFGDKVRGELYNLPELYYSPDAYSKTSVPQPNQNAPRVPPARFGFRTNWQITENLSTSFEYIYVFRQDKTMAPKEKRNIHGELVKDEQTQKQVWFVTESPTPGHNMVNLSLDYMKKINNIDYHLFIQGNNLLNEKVYSHTSFLPFVPQMGRNITMGMNVRF
ncbi:TonB-dependent receptor domain-containing protein [Pasteurella multocida]|uniref:TonB-dependent receptor domain-containing protein n=1 Tax=Pasteurella multocida TaxID=747 RepID=UPI003CF145DF